MRVPARAPRHGARLAELLLEAHAPELLRDALQRREARAERGVAVGRAPRRRRPRPRAQEPHARAPRRRRRGRRRRGGRGVERECLPRLPQRVEGLGQEPVHHAQDDDLAAREARGGLRAALALREEAPGRPGRRGEPRGAVGQPDHGPPHGRVRARLGQRLGRGGPGREGDARPAPQQPEDDAPGEGLAAPLPRDEGRPRAQPRAQLRLREPAEHPPGEPLRAAPLPVVRDPGAEAPREVAVAEHAQDPEARAARDAQRRREAGPAPPGPRDVPLQPPAARAHDQEVAPPRAAAPQPTLELRRRGVARRAVHVGPGPPREGVAVVVGVPVVVVVVGPARVGPEVVRAEARAGPERPHGRRLHLRPILEEARLRVEVVEGLRRVPGEDALLAQAPRAGLRRAEADAPPAPARRRRRRGRAAALPSPRLCPVGHGHGSCAARRRSPGARRLRRGNHSVPSITCR